jgi:hypothetical protein
MKPLPIVPEDKRSERTRCRADEAGLDAAKRRLKRAPLYSRLFSAPARIIAFAELSLCGALKGRRHSP